MSVDIENLLCSHPGRAYEIAQMLLEFIVLVLLIGFKKINKVHSSTAKIFNRKLSVHFLFFFFLRLPLQSTSMKVRAKISFFEQDNSQFSPSSNRRL